MDVELRLRRPGIDAAGEAIVYLDRASPACRTLGLAAPDRLLVTHGGKAITARLNLVPGTLIGPDEAGLSEAAWNAIMATEGGPVTICKDETIDSMSHVRAKVFGHRLDAAPMEAILSDIVDGRYSDIQLAAFVTACAARPLGTDEIAAMTGAMVDTGARMSWPPGVIADKHCVGGLPGNRTTPIVVAIAAACGLMIPKTSSRAITSPAGTADMMETLAPVNLTLDHMRRVVESEGGCIVWGGAVDLSPADDILIRIERALGVDSHGQLIASVLSKKIAAGATHLVIDLPVGPSAKIRSAGDAETLSRTLLDVARRFGVHVRVLKTNGAHPVGRGIGPALEARDVLQVLRNEAEAPDDLRAKAVTLAGALLELAGMAAEGGGEGLAERTLASGRAWKKFQAICAAQGGMAEPPSARHRQTVHAQTSGRVNAFDNRLLSRAAILAGAPEEKAAGLDLHVRAGDMVEEGQPLLTLHSQSVGELAQALAFVQKNHEAIITLRS